MKDVSRFGTPVIKDAKSDMQTDLTLQVAVKGFEKDEAVALKMTHKGYAISFKVIDNSTNDLVFYYLGKIEGFVIPHPPPRDPKCGGTALRIINHNSYSLFDNSKCVPSEYSSMSLMFVDEFISQLNAKEDN